MEVNQSPLQVLYHSTSQNIFLVQIQKTDCRNFTFSPGSDPLYPNGPTQDPTGESLAKFVVIALHLCVSSENQWRPSCIKN